MKKVLVVSFCLLFALSSIALAKQVSKGTPQYRVQTAGTTDLDRPLDEQGVFASAQAGTLQLCYYTFDGAGSCDMQGWTSHDITEQPRCFWHVDDFGGLGGGSYGGLVALEGDQSLWCGSRPDSTTPPDPVTCGYAALPGYGNGWDQGWCFKCIDVPVANDVMIDYKVAWDSEPGYDYTYVQYATKGSCDSLVSVDLVPSADWVELYAFDYVGAEIHHDTIPAGHAGSIKIRFQFTSDGAWSDQDGLWDTDGAIIIDSLTVRDELLGVPQTTYDYEDFEDEAWGDQQTLDGDWECCLLTGFGDYAGLYPGTTLLQEDPCNYNPTCMWAFIEGSTETYACGGHPEQRAVPKENQRGQFISDEIWSPEIPWVGSGSAANLTFDVYRDLPLDNLMFYVWHIRSIDAAGCPGDWRDRNFVYYGGNKDWIRPIQPVGDLVDGGAVNVQIALGAVDMCPYWCIVYGTGACHSHAPLLDNVELYRIDSAGPQWSVRDIDLFNDTFPENGTPVGTGRIDMALDRLPSSNPAILPGDSAKVLCSDAVAGIREPDPNTGFGGAVYFYLYRQNSGKAPLTSADAASIEEDGFRWPVVGDVNCDGVNWVVFRCDTAFTEPSGPRTGPVPDSWCIDINDHYFTNGDTLLFFFGAENTINEWTWWSQGSGTTIDINEACAAPMEIQILPGAGYERGGDILYVDNFSGRGGQVYFDTSFQQMGIFDLVDRFDKRGPSSLVGNSVCHRGTAAQLQLYRKIIWHSGDLSVGTVGDGTSEKSDDFAVLFTWMDQHPNVNGCGLYLSGDDMAQEWSTMTSPSSAAFIGTYIPHALVTGDHNDLHGTSPLGIGTGTVFVHGGVPDTLVAYGGCAIINDFDVVAPVAPSILEMAYDGELDNPAVISHTTLNAVGNTAKVVLSGFAFHYIRDDRPSGIPDRTHHLTDIIRFLGNILDDPVPVDPIPLFTNSLAQNFPNPFNPSTTIKYSIKERAHVTLKIYNVAGQLVKTLVNNEQLPKSEGYTMKWNGRSDSGNPVSSGVYFYKLVTKNFTQTKKMVLLK
jgi:hypothetical protein